MARKIMAALALVALTATAACNSVTGPVDVKDAPPAVDPGGNHHPVGFGDPGKIAPDPVQGGSDGSAARTAAAK